MNEQPKTGRNALNRRGLLKEIQLYLRPLTPEDKLAEIDFVIDNILLDERRLINVEIKSKKEAQKKADTALVKSIGQEIKSKSEDSTFYRFDKFLKGKKEGGYKKSIRTRKNIKKNNKSFRRK
jgi:hypothetical protein